MGLFSGCEGEPPPGRGIQDGKLAACPGTPNCVSSMSDNDEHFLEPINYDNMKRKGARERLLNVLYSFKNATIIENNHNYIITEFKIPVMGFVDDVTFLMPEDENTIHFRSASRLGKYDFGVNKRRMKKIKNRFKKE